MKWRPSDPVRSQAELNAIVAGLFDYALAHGLRFETAVWKARKAYLARLESATAEQPKGAA